MSNVLSEHKRQQVLALGRLGWPLRRIDEETGVRRETASAYLPSRWHRGAASGTTEGGAARVKTGTPPKYANASSSPLMTVAIVCRE